MTFASIILLNCLFNQRNPVLKKGETKNSKELPKYHKKINKHVIKLNGGYLCVYGKNNFLRNLLNFNSNETNCLNPRLPVAILKI